MPLNLKDSRARIDMLKDDAEELYKGTPFYNGSASASVNGHKAVEVKVNIVPSSALPKVFAETDAELRALEEKKKAEAEANAFLWHDVWEADPRIYLPTLENAPEPITPLLKLHNSVIGSVGNLSMIVADAGSGKSAVCEAECSRAINPLSDAFGLSVFSHRRVLYVDTERSDRHHWESLERMLRRAEASKDYLHSDTVLFSNFRSVETVEERQNLLFPAMGSGAFDLAIIDGVADFVHDPNDLAESSALCMRLAAIANAKNLHIQCTLHQNPGEAQKPRGHLGSELLRRCESVLILEHDRETGIRTLTMNNRYGKNRADRDDLKTHFTWDYDAHMFTTCASPDGTTYGPQRRPTAHQKRREEWSDIVTEVFGATAELPYQYLVRRLVEISEKSDRTCKRAIEELQIWGEIEKDPANGMYRKVRIIGMEDNENDAF